jgi:3-isopropylmalate/(R)-2-methylmalate dehydratase large subunit
MDTSPAENARRTLYDKVFDRHVVREVAPGQYQLFADIHLLNEVSSPQAFEALRERGLKVRFAERTFATSDHSIATAGDPNTAGSDLNVRQVAALAANSRASAIRYFDADRGEHGIMHVVAPERGMIQPGMTVVCGDSHTATHGAFATLAFGIGTSQVRDVLATQTLLMEKLKVRRIEIDGTLGCGVYAKDVALHIIATLGAKGGVGYAYEYAGQVVDGFSMEERMTLCNMSIEGGARCGYVNPDSTTFAYLRGREFGVSAGAEAEWQAIASDAGAEYADFVCIDGSTIAPTVSWGTSPDQSVPVDAAIPHPDELRPEDRQRAADSLAFMGFAAGQEVAGTPIDVAFIGSCTNGRLSDFEAVADLLNSGDYRVAAGVRALIVPGSRAVRDALVTKGFDRLFIEAGFELRDAGCSLCCGMNPDSLVGREVCASSSNRNFKGRQGSPTGRTLLMSPVMVAAAAISGKVVDARRLFAGERA